MHQIVNPEPIVLTVTWRPIDWLPGGYEVSDDGQVRDFRGHIIVPCSNLGGYLQVRMLRGSKRRLTKSVHRLVARAFLGECPERHEVNHKDGNRMNARLENLEYVTRQQNLVHGYRRRRIEGEYPAKDRPRGESVPGAKLTEEKVREIRSLGLTSITFSDIARRYGVTQPLIAAIVKRRIWKHIA